MDEKNMAEYIASLAMSAFVMDYDHNAYDPPHLEKTHEVFFKTIRTAHPDLPILIISRPDYDRDPALAEACFSIIKRTYDHAIASGDKHVRLIDGRTLFGTPIASSAPSTAAIPRILGSCGWRT